MCVNKPYPRLTLPGIRFIYFLRKKKSLVHLIKAVAKSIIYSDCKLSQSVFEVTPFEF